MNKILRVLIVEDDTLACQEFKELIEEHRNLYLIGITNESQKAIEYINSYTIDAIILDIELQHGSGSGLDILHSISNSDCINKPFILVTTNNSSKMTLEFTRKLGGDFIMPKQQKGYSVEYALNFLCMMQSTMTGLSNKHEIIAKPSTDDIRFIRKKIVSELNLVGISPKLKGYQYLIDAIEILIEQPQQHICKKVGYIYTKTAASVERAINTAINKAWNESDSHFLAQYYTPRIDPKRGAPTITEFVYYYAIKIRNNF